MATIGGGTIRNYRFTRAWGVNPAEAGGTAVVDSSSTGGFTLEPGNFVTFSFDLIASFSGVVQDVGVVESTDEGSVYDFTILDNRLRLGQNWAWVVGAWNVEDDRYARRIDMPLSPNSYNSNSSGPGGSDNLAMNAGVDNPDEVPTVSVAAATANNPLRQRRFKHLLPEHARAGIWTYTDEPLTARQILNSAFGGAWGDYTFSRNYHSSMSSTFPMGVDASSGMTMASLISQICEICGLEMKLEGTRDLYFDRKGEGLVPLPDLRTGTRSVAESLSPNPSKVRVVGDPFRVQVHNISLVPDWRTGWEAWIDEAAWVRKVGDVFALPSATKADLAERAAFAREVTVQRFVTQAGLSDLADHRPFGSISRMAMPAWSYIQNLVYRSYRIPANYSLGGIPLASMRWAEGMLAGVGISGIGAGALQRIRSDSPELYPDSRVHVMVQGQPLDLIDGRSIALFSQRRNRNLRVEWTEWPEVEIDDQNWSIRFATPVFKDGDPALGQSVLLKINAGQGTGSVDVTALVEANSDYLDVVVPNPEFVIAPAAVKIALCFEFGRFQQDFGSGPRRMVASQAGIGMELVDTSSGSSGLAAYLQSADSSLLPFPSSPGVSLSEVQYADGGVASQKAAALADSLIERDPIQVSGGFPRYGIAGTALSSAVDRVSLAIDPDGGLVETVEFTKARPTGAFLAERTLTRLARAGELFPGAEEARNEIRQLRLIARAERAAVKDPNGKTHRTMSDLFSRPIGGENPSVTLLYDKNNAAPVRGGVKAWKAGDCVWTDAQGFPSQEGKTFAGVLVAAPKNGNRDLIVATRGIVPMRISGGQEGGSPVMGEPGAAIAGGAGSRPLGTLHHHSTVPSPPEGEVLALVRLGSGGGSGAAAEKIGPLTIVRNRPSYIRQPDGTTTAARFYMTWGEINGRLAQNWDKPIDVAFASGGDAQTFNVWANITISNSTVLAVSSWSIVVDNDGVDHLTPAWPVTGRPAQAWYKLGSIYRSSDGQIFPFSSGGGYLDMREIVSRITDSGSGALLVERGFAFHRQNY